MDHTRLLLNTLSACEDLADLHFSYGEVFRTVHLRVGYLLIHIGRNRAAAWRDLNETLAEATDLYMVSADLKKVTRISADG